MLSELLEKYQNQKPMDFGIGTERVYPISAVIDMMIEFAEYKLEKKELLLADTNTVLVPVFLSPFRIGKKQMRAVLDAKGVEVVIFSKGLESYAKEYADFLNSTIYENDKK